MQTKHSKAFTVVEIVIVIIVIAIISTLGVIAYDSVQKDSRDTERRADATIFTNALENYFNKNGEYPPGCNLSVDRCPVTPYIASYSDTTPHFTSLTTKNTIEQVLGEDLSEFGDPNSTNNRDQDYTPFYDRYTVGERTRHDRYVYFGGFLSPTEPHPPSGGTGFSGPYSDASFQCTPRINTSYPYKLSPINSSKVSSYLFAYYSEVENKWVIHTGRKGIKDAITDGCHHPSAAGTYRYEPNST